MLLPALNKAREAARKISCVNNMKQYGVIFSNYIDDNKEWFLYRSGGAYYYWNTLLGELGYSKAVDTSMNIKMSVYPCPSYERKGKNSNLGYSTYLLNMVNVDTAWGGKYGLGGGLYGAMGMANGCKLSQIVRGMSLFTVLAEACNYHRYWSPYVFENYSMFCTRERTSCGTASGREGLGLNQHTNSSNYLRADGHVENLIYKNVTWDTFCIQSTTFASKRYF